MNMPRGYKHAVGSKSSWNHLLTHIFVIFALMIKPHHQGCQEVTICSSLMLRDSKDLQSRWWCCDCRPSKLCVVGAVLWSLEMCIICSMWRVGVLFPKLNCLSLFKWGKDHVKLLRDSYLAFCFWRMCGQWFKAVIRQWLVNHWVWDFLLIFFLRKVSQYKSW